MIFGPMSSGKDGGVSCSAIGASECGMRHHRACGTLLATSSALALVVAIDQSAEAATCTVVTNPTLPYVQSGNTCVTFTTSPGTSGNITNTGTVTASGGANPNATGISLY